MLRRLVLLLLLAGIVVAALPFFVSSAYIDRRGITLPGRVRWKAETVTVHHTAWQRASEVTVEYHPPDTAVVSFLGVRLTPEDYDSLHIGQDVSVRYLPAADIPKLPLAKVLREIHALPMAHLAGHQSLSEWRAFFSGSTAVVAFVLGAMVVLLIAWRIARVPGFAWAVGVCVLLGVALMMIDSFPTPVPRPATDVRRGTGKVASIGRIDRLFEGTRSRGLDMLQPVDVVGIQFVPEGRIEPVVAVDLIDSGSVAGLRKDAAVRIEYESASPRTAYISDAARSFAGRNIWGALGQAAAYLLVVGLLLTGAHYFGVFWKRLLARR